jgi:hypothetical protein
MNKESAGILQIVRRRIYAYPSLQPLLEAESHGGAKTPLPGAGDMALTERPG